MKYRQLTKEQFEGLHEEFARFLASQNIDKKEWDELKKEKPNVAEEEMNVFSDVVWDDVLTKTTYLEHFSKQTVNLFKCYEEEMNRIVIQVRKEVNLLEKSDYEWLLKNEVDLPMSIYEPEIFSGYRIMDDNRYKNLYKSSYNLTIK